jgi:hypothetical protein
MRRTEVAILHKEVFGRRVRQCGIFEFNEGSVVSINGI